MTIYTVTAYQLPPQQGTVAFSALDGTRVQRKLGHTHIISVVNVGFQQGILHSSNPISHKYKI